MGTASDPIPMEVTAVRRVDGGDKGIMHVVVLSEAEGHRTMPIWVGAAEATSLALALDGTTLPRPNTYQLTVSLLTAAGGRVDAVEIAGLTEGVFYARLVLGDGSAVDARPSDALNIAVLVDAPVRVDPAVVQAVDDRPRHIPPGPSDHRAIAAETVAAWRAVATSAEEVGS